MIAPAKFIDFANICQYLGKETVDLVLGFDASDAMKVLTDLDGCIAKLSDAIGGPVPLVLSTKVKKCRACAFRSPNEGSLT